MAKLFPLTAFVLGIAFAAAALAAYPYATLPTPATAEGTRSEARSEVASDVIDRGLPLLDAAAAFHQFNAQAPALAEVLEEKYPADSEGERACLHVIAYVRAELKGRSMNAEGGTSVDAADAVLARLEGELKAARAEDGTIVLPVTAD